ncbi:MAG: hypothetical protein J0H74_15685 [Chitinophagaceae bacterium]|nr:hypothetical protein [Chitinophagaceae bacterium]
MRKKAKDQFVRFFKGKPQFTREELHDYFLAIEGEINEGTFGWRIYDLKQKNILREIQRGWYTLEVRPVYKPVIDPTIQELANLLKKSFRNVPNCIWNISWLNEFTVHQFSSERIILETEKDLQESLANILGDNGYHNVIWSIKGQPPRNNFKEIPILLLPLISRAPVQSITIDDSPSVVIPTLEKILVDIYEGSSAFHFLQGAEIERIFEHAIERYAINYSTLLNYARRRGKDIELRAFLSKYVQDTVKNYD